MWTGYCWIMVLGLNAAVYKPACCPSILGPISGGSCIGSGGKQSYSVSHGTRSWEILPIDLVLFVHMFGETVCVCMSVRTVHVDSFLSQCTAGMSKKTIAGDVNSVKQSQLDGWLCFPQCWCFFINPCLRTCAARFSVCGLCLCVCVSICPSILSSSFVWSNSNVTLAL